jgi:hypothetical protein
MTLMDLLLGIVFFMPIYATVAGVKQSGGGALRFLVAVPSALVLGILIVFVDWRLGKALWLRSRQYSEKVQSVVSVALFAFEAIWIFLGLVSGKSWLR